MTDEMNTTTGVALDVWDIVAVVIYFGLIMGVGLLVSQPFEAFHQLSLWICRKHFWNFPPTYVEIPIRVFQTL